MTKNISQLDQAAILGGLELVPIWQGGDTVRTALSRVQLLTSNGVVGDGTNERAKAQEVIDACSAAGGGIVDGSGLTVGLDLTPHPVDSAYKVGLVVPANVELRRVTAKLRAGQATDGVAVMNREIQGTATVRGPIFTDVTVDGNGADQSHVHSGLMLRKAHGARLRYCTARNCRGTATSGAGETFHFEVQASSDTAYLFCLVEGTAGSTASAYSVNIATGTFYLGCVARGMTIANGFTNSLSTHTGHVRCWSYLNALHAYNSEFSTDGFYDSCLAGGYAVNDVGNSAYPYTAGQSLGNGGHGYNILGGSRIVLTSPGARKNANSGIVFASAAAECQVIGGDVFENANWGLFVDAASVPLVRIDPLPVMNNNAYGNFGFGAMTAFNDPANPTQPASVPASGVATVSPYSIDATVYVSGGTVSAIAVGGRTTGLISGAIRWPVGKALTLTYTVAPTLSVVLA